MEKQLLLKLLNHEFYEDNKHLVKREYFPKNLQPLWNTVQQAQETYTEDLTPSVVKRLHNEFNPAMTTRQRDNIAIVLDDMAHSDAVPNDMAVDIMKRVHRRESARAVAQEAVKVINGSVATTANLKLMLGDLDDDKFDADTFKEIEYDLDSLLDSVSLEHLFKFRLPSLRAQVPGAGRGHFAIIFARTEIGKSTFSCSEAAGFLMQGLKVAYFINEDPAKAMYTRLISSYTEKTILEMLADKTTVNEKFGPVSKNLHMMDCVGMDITEVDIWCKENQPDVVFLDQLDNFQIGGAHNSDTEKLGSIYRYTREIAKRRDCLIFAVTQASVEAQGLATIQKHMMENSKTAKQATADLIIGIGYNDQVHPNEETRQINVDKNKINSWHGHVICHMDKEKALFND
jgi:archaellum biogenesis ATPase FlaH